MMSLGGCIHRWWRNLLGLAGLRWHEGLRHQCAHIWGPRGPGWDHRYSRRACLRIQTALGWSRGTGFATRTILLTATRFALWPGRWQVKVHSPRLPLGFCEKLLCMASNLNSCLRANVFCNHGFLQLSFFDRLLGMKLTACSEKKNRTHFR